MACGCAQADTTQKWNTASNVLTAAVPAMAAGMVLHQGDATGARELALSLGSALAAAELLKNTVHSTRPDGSDNKSFPSAQTALAFAEAGFVDERYAQTYGAWVPAAAYGTAALTGVARVQAKKHHWGDVLAGGALGWGSARLWTEPLAGGRLSVLPAQGGLAVAWAGPF